jgi:hypothetical protein
MTHEIIHGRAGEGLDASACRTPNKGSPEAVHAYVDNGRLLVMFGGQFWQCTRSEAWSYWLEASQSPIASTQERARQIRAAMDEAYPQDIAA